MVPPEVPGHADADRVGAQIDVSEEPRSEQSPSWWRVFRYQRKTAAAALGLQGPQSPTTRQWRKAPRTDLLEDALDPTHSRADRRRVMWEKRLMQSKTNLPGAGHSKAGPLSRLVFWWMNPVVNLAYAKPLEQENLWAPPASCLTDAQLSRFDKEWALEMTKPNGHRSLIWAMARTFKTELLITAVGAVLTNAFTLVVPLLIQQLLQWFEEDSPTPATGWCIAVALFLSGFIGNGLLGNHFFLKLYIMGMDARTTLNAMVYRKSLALSNKARQSTSMGNCVTLMSNDAQRMPDAALQLHQIWIAPIFIIVALYLLLNLVGVSGVGGVGFMVLIMPVQAKIAMRQMKVQLAQMVRTEARIKLVNEVLQGIKIVKYYAWEAPFRERIAALRKAELGRIKSFAYLNAYSMALLMGLPVGMVIITMVILYNTSNKFTPSVVFTASSLLLVIRFPLFMLPATIASLVQGKISLGRLQSFFELEELSTTDDKREWTNKDGNDRGAGDIFIRGGTFVWETADVQGQPAAATRSAVRRSCLGLRRPAGKTVAQLPHEGFGIEEADGLEVLSGNTHDKLATIQVQEEPRAVAIEPLVVDGAVDNVETAVLSTHWQLHTGDVAIGAGELVAVVGQVGSGKSSLVSACLGEMTCLKGHVSCDGSIAYVAQTAWIVNATLQENVLMGKAMNSQRYQQVLEACDLTQDLAILPAGDLTEIGEKGINLSGGQRQRVSLARAAYADTDLCIMDDPLSAVDAHVARHIFDKCFKGFLHGKTVLLCCNQLQFLSEVDRVLVMHQGRIVEDTSNAHKKVGGHLDILLQNFGSGGEDVVEDAAHATTTPSATRAPLDAVVLDIQGAVPSSQRRQSHTAPVLQADHQKADGKGKAGSTLVQAEEKGEGTVGWAVYRTYFRDGTGGWALPIWLLVVTAVSQGWQSVSDYWLSIWSEAYLTHGKSTALWYEYVYILLGAGLLIWFLARGISFAEQCLASSRILHTHLVDGVLRAPMSFFDTTPTGRILNRFSKDMDAIDLLLPRNIPMFAYTLLTILGVLITICVLLPWFLVPAIPLMIIYWGMQRRYRPVSRDLQRLESLSRSPIFAQFTETLAGATTLRAYNKQAAFIRENSRRLDESCRAFYHLHVANRWLQVRLEAIGSSIMLVVAFLIVMGKTTHLVSINAGVAGLVLTYVQQMTGQLNWAVRQGCETEARITSAERVKEYGDLTPEAPAVNADYRPPKGWPHSGAITFQQISMRYRPDLELVLKGVSLDVRGGEKVGIVGRTGSGKSSLMVILFRIVEPCGGTILIDGVDALRLGIHDLRRAISIIPQDPVMFNGTIRENLDPFGHYSDKVLWDGLRSAHLLDFVSGLQDKLDSEIAEGGENLSLGQRQLLCLARAILRRNRILVMDEATANIDVDTDALIQTTIRREFSRCTVLTIAHRLNTIMDSDRIVVMKDGSVAECDTPANLVSAQGSLLMGFIEQTGPSARRLVNMAKSAQLSVGLQHLPLDKGAGPTH